MTLEKKTCRHRFFLGRSGGWVTVEGLRAPGSCAELFRCEAQPTTKSIKYRADPRENIPTLSRNRMRQVKYLPAVVLFSESIKLYRAIAVTYLDRGSARKALDEVDLATSDFNTAITLRPGLAKAWYYRGATLLIWINMIGLYVICLRLLG